MIHSIEKVGFFWKLPISLYFSLASFCKISKLSFEKGYITKKYLTNLVTPKLKTLLPKWHWCTKIGAIYRIGNPKTKISIYSSRDPKPHVVSWPIVAMQCNTGNPWITRFQSTRSTAVPGLTRFFLKEIAWFPPFNTVFIRNKISCHMKTRSSNQFLPLMIFGLQSTWIDFVRLLKKV